MSKEQKTDKKDPTKIVNSFEDTFKLFMFSEDEIIKLYRKIKLIRDTEFKIASEREKGNIGGPVHLSIGQEAIATGVSLNLNKNDYVFGAHRSHAHIIALGSPITKLFAELYLNVTSLNSISPLFIIKLFDLSLSFILFFKSIIGIILLAADKP